MSTHKNSFDLVREKEELDAFLSDITQEGRSDLVHEKRQLDSFLATIIGDGSSPAPSADIIESGKDATRMETAGPEDEREADQGVSGSIAETSPQTAGPAVSIAPEPVSVPPEREETFIPRDGKIIAVEEPSLTVDSEGEIAAAAFEEATSAEPLQSPASNDEAGPEIELTVNGVPSTANQPIVPVLEMEVPAERVTSEPPRYEAGAGEPLAAETLKMEEVPAADDFERPHTEPAGPVLDEIEFVAAEDHRQDRKEPDASPDRETSGFVPPVTEKMETTPLSDFQRAAVESMPEPGKTRDDEMSKDLGPAATQEPAKSEPAETALPTFIIRRETRVDDHPAPPPPVLDKTLELPKSVSVAKEPDIATVPSVDKDKPLTREEHVFGKSLNKTKRSWIQAGVLAAILAAMLQGYVWLYPDAGQQAIRWMAVNIPYFDQLVGVEQKKEPTISQQIKFTDIRQRFVYNIPLGRNIRVIEGMAVNHATSPISTIKILGELYDARGSILASKVIYCGNILSDEKLETLGEGEITSALSIPQGNDLSNSKILPQGQIPFMIIFVQEPVGVVKTTIMPISAAGVSP